MRNYRDLEVWGSAHRLTLRVYQLTRAFPRDEMYGLISQIRRSASSIGANLAEGCGAGTDSAFARYVQHSSASASELDYHLLLARDLGYLSETDYAPASEELSSIRRRLTALLTRLRQDA
jgi:four helix bundle protein